MLKYRDRNPESSPTFRDSKTILCKRLNVIFCFCSLSGLVGGLGGVGGREGRGYIKTESIHMATLPNTFVISSFVPLCTTYFILFWNKTRGHKRRGCPSYTLRTSVSQEHTAYCTRTFDSSGTRLNTCPSSESARFLLTKHGFRSP